MLAVAIWRHGVRRFPLVSDPMYWGLVFPLGMYAVATLRMLRVMNLQFLAPLPRIAFGLAVVVWASLVIG